MRIAILLIPLAFAAAPPYLIDDFEHPLQNWTFHTTSESPAPGGLTIGPGHHDHGAVLSYHFPCCGYVEAMWKAPASLPKHHNPAIALWIRFAPGVDVSVVAKDSGGQTLLFPILPTIEHPSAGDWQYVVVPFKGRLAEAGIRVQPRTNAPIEGEVDFDDVELREGSDDFRIDLSAPTDAPPATHTELGVNIHLLQDNPALDQAHAAGFTFVRMDMEWRKVERSGRYRFFAYDALLRSLDARHMGILWILDYGHPDHGGTAPRTAQDVAAFARFAEAAAAHFKGRNVRYEIWNEPNLQQFWEPAPNASEYGVLLREAAAAIRRADPSAKVSSGGVSRMDEPFLSRAIVPSLAAGLTAIAIHPYPKNGPESIAPDLALLREWVTGSLGKHLEVWDTEWGYSSTEIGRKKQAAFAVREMLTAWALGFPLAVWYDLRDDGTDHANPEQNYGLLDSDGNEKPAMRAMRTFANVAGAHKYTGMLRETPAGIHAMRFENVVIVWTDKGRRSVKVTGNVSATNLLGEPIKTKDKVQLDTDAGPVYLVNQDSR